MGLGMELREGSSSSSSSLQHAGRGDDEHRRCSEWNTPILLLCVCVRVVSVRERES